MTNTILSTTVMLLVAAVMVGFHSVDAVAQSRSSNGIRLADKARLIVQTGNSGQIRAIAFSPDSQFVATADDVGVGVIWNIGGSQLQSFRYQGSITDIAFSVDNRLVSFVVEVEDGKTIAYVRNLTNGDDVSRLTLKGESLGSLTLSPRGDFLLINATSGDVQTTLLWNIAQRMVVRRFDASESSAFSPDGHTILVLVRKNENPLVYALQSWNSVTWELNWENNAATEQLLPSNRLAFSPDGIHVIASSARAKCHYALFDSATGNLISEKTCFGEFDSDYTEFWISADRKYFIAFDGNATGSGGHFDNTVRVQNFATGKLVSHFGRVSSVVNTIKATSADRSELLIGDMLGNAYLWHLAEGKEVRRFIDPAPEESNGEDAEELTASGTQPIASISANGRFVLTEPAGGFGSVYVWDGETGNLIKEIDGRALSVSVSASGEKVALGRCYRLRLVNLPTATEIWQKQIDGGNCGGMVGDRIVRNTSQVSQDGKYVFVGTYDKGTAALLDATSGRVIRRYSNIFGWPVFLSPNGRYVIVQMSENSDNQKSSFGKAISVLMETFTGRVIKRITGANRAMSFSPDNRTLLVSTTVDSLSLFNTTTGKLSKQIFPLDLSVSDVGFSPDGRFVLVGDQDGSTRFYEPGTGQEICRIFSFRDGRWVVVAPDGRFDTNNLEEIGGLLWVMPDEPLKPLPLEIFMRQYYEPRLLPRLLECNKGDYCGQEFKPVRDISKLNRVQARVKIKDVSLPDADGYVNVTVEVGRGDGKYLVNGKEGVRRTGVYDVRLFRDGQIVGSWPSDGAEKLLEGTPKDFESNESVTGEKRFLEELNEWQQATEVKPDDRIKIDQETQVMTLPSFRVKMPLGRDVSQIEFTAYAFNEDRVKSQTTKWEWPADVVATLPKAQPIKPRAYIIAVGANAYENSDFDLKFAADDARRMAEVVTQKLNATGQYGAVIPITLISDYEAKANEKITTEKQATKANFHAVLDLLAGKNVDRQLLAGIKSADQLQKATPDDLVLIMYSSHGYADRAGNFYFIPYDTGPGKGKIFTDSVRRHSISSDELSLWLRDVDAGEMIMIVDACHSSAAIKSGDFKPGPMGSRGLGQLSYDKGMKILTATQSDNVALENNLIKQGLLTYALVRDGIEARQADFKPKDNVINIGEWLSYGVDRVPKLYEEVQAGKIQNFGIITTLQTRAVVATQSGKSGGKSLDEIVIEAKAQQPSLFDFTRKRNEVALVK